MTINVQKINEVYIKVTADPSIEEELFEYMTFKVKGYKFMPAYRNGSWDGNIRLYNKKTKLIYHGLLSSIESFAKLNDYDISINFDKETKSLKKEDLLNFFESLNLPFEVRDYQKESFQACIENNRLTLLSPTGSGKSAIIYLLCKYYNLKTLIVVPTTTLIHQMCDDFKSYGYTENIHKIFSGKEKDDDSMIFCSTWQSIYKMPKQWFDQFDVLIVDECHTAKAASLVKLATSMENCKYRFGVTGTLDDSVANILVIQGLFGKVQSFVSTKQLIADQHLSNFDIKCIILEYDDDTRKMMKGMTYFNEMEYIVTNKARNDFICKFVSKLNGNTLLLFQFVEKHGTILFDQLSKMTDKKVYFIHGKVPGDIRNEVRKIVEESDDAIIIASSQTFSAGINIKSLVNIVFASPSKARIKILQSIGRVLRKYKGKQATLYDIADDLSWKSHKNYTLLHFIERIKLYNSEQFDYKIYKRKI